MSVPREWGTLFLLYDVVLVLQIIHLDNQDNEKSILLQSKSCYYFENPVEIKYYTYNLFCGIK